MASPSCRGVSRVWEKLENSIKNKDYYEAHQMYRTLYFRYLAQKRYNDLKEKLYQGSILFLDADQCIAKIYWDELNYVQARHHYVHSQDGKNCAKLLIEFQMTKGFKNEVDLFIAQAVLQLLCLRNQITASQTFNTYTENHPTIRRTEPPYLLPLLNFLWFLLKAVENKKIQTFANLCSQYENSIRRDPCYIQYLDKIGQLFFGLKPPEEKKPVSFFGSLLDNFLGGLDDESDDDAPESSSSSQAASTSRRPVDTADLD